MLKKKQVHSINTATATTHDGQQENNQAAPLACIALLIRTTYQIIAGKPCVVFVIPVTFWVANSDCLISAFVSKVFRQVSRMF